MSFPSKVLVNKYPKKFSNIGLCLRLASKGERKVMATFLLSRFENDISRFFYIHDNFYNLAKLHHFLLHYLVEIPRYLG